MSGYLGFPPERENEFHSNPDPDGLQHHDGEQCPASDGTYRCTRYAGHKSKGHVTWNPFLGRVAHRWGDPMTAGWQDGPPDYQHDHNPDPYTGPRPIRDRGGFALAYAAAALSGFFFGVAAMSAALWAGWIG